MTQNFLDNTLYEMDNLIVLRGMNTETIDLIATDPPFNTKRNREGTAGQYEDKWVWLKDLKKRPDQWKWNEIHPKWLEEIEDNHKALHAAIKAAEKCQGKDTAAFLCFMSVRLLEMHRILKPTGSIYLHCDATVSHYIKTCMDAIFGKENFRNEIVWKRTERGFKGSQFNPIRYNSNTDSILFYAKTKKSFFNMADVLEPYDPDYLEKAFKLKDMKGAYYLDVMYNRKSASPRPNLCYEYRGFSPPYPSGWKVGFPRMQELDKEGELVIEKNTLYRKIRPKEGRIRKNLWDDIGEAKGNERTGSPDQKPVALYERIIQASSKEGDLVLDPFCGCATTIIAANNLKRRWIGIDRRTDARYHIVTRLLGLSRKDRDRLKKRAINEKWLNKQIQACEMHYQSEPPFGVECWGCGFEPPDNDDRYLHLDHINPKSSGGTNDIDNRSILCQPCNSKKLNTMTLDGLRKKNEREKHMKKSKSQLIDISSAVQWTRNYMLEIREQTPKQYELFSNKA